MLVLAGSGKTEKRQVSEPWQRRQCYGRHRHSTWNMALFVLLLLLFFFCLAPVDHVSSEIEKRKTARAQFPKRKREKQTSLPKNPQKGLASLAPHWSESRNLSFRPLQSFLIPAKGQFPFRGGKVAASRHIKGTKEDWLQRCLNQNGVFAGWETRARRVFCRYLTAPPQTHLDVSANQSASGHLVSLSCPARLIRTAARWERTTSVPVFGEPFVLCVPVVCSGGVW